MAAPGERTTVESRGAALGSLRVLRERYLACEDMTPALFLRISRVLRRFLREHCGIPARVETVDQILARFRGHPLEEKLTQVLERCTEVVYDAHRPTLSDKDQLIQKVTTLIEELERTGCPPCGGNGAPR